MEPGLEPKLNNFGSATLIESYEQGGGGYLGPPALLLLFASLHHLHRSEEVRVSYIYFKWLLRNCRLVWNVYKKLDTRQFVRNFFRTQNFKISHFNVAFYLGAVALNILTVTLKWAKTIFYKHFLSLR